jgi:hypothetical protein
VDPSRFPVPRANYNPRAGGRTYYVATSGNDSADGSSGAPLASINTAVSRARSGDTVLIAGGSYRLNGEGFGLTIATNDLIVAGLPGQRVKVTGSGYGIQLRGDRVVLDGFELSGFAGGGIYFGREDTAQKDVQILNTSVTGGADGIRSVVVGSGRTTPVIQGLLLYNVQIYSSTLVHFNCGEGPCDDVRLERVTVRGAGAGNSGNSGADAIAFESGHNLALVDVDVSAVDADGIDTKADGVLILASRAHDLARNGMKLWRGGDIMDSAVWNTGADAAIVFDGLGAYRLINTTVAMHNQGRSGAYVMTVAYDNPGAGSLQITNCIFYKNSGSIWLPSQFQLTVKNSIFMGAADGVEIDWGGQQYGAGAQSIAALESRGGGSGNLGYIEPKFMNYQGGDYRLATDSPAINRGTPVSPGATTDMVGAPRTQGGVIDLGPWEKR